MGDQRRGAIRKSQHRATAIVLEIHQKYTILVHIQSTSRQNSYSHISCDMKLPSVEHISSVLSRSLLLCLHVLSILSFQSISACMHALTKLWGFYRSGQAYNDILHLAHSINWQNHLPVPLHISFSHDYLAPCASHAEAQVQSESNHNKNALHNLYPCGFFFWSLPYSYTLIHIPRATVEHIATQATRSRTEALRLLHACQSTRV